MTRASGPSLAGKLLAAMPGIEDPRFERSVIAMCMHDEDGALGIGLGRVIPRLGFHDLLEQLDIEPGVAPNAAIHLGGPVEPERGFVLHTDDYARPESSVSVGPGVMLTATREVLEAIAAPQGHTRKAVMALGYAAWQGGQLEREIRENVWLTCEADENLVFGDDHPHKWSRALAKIGVAAENLSAQAGSA